MFFFLRFSLLLLLFSFVSIWYCVDLCCLFDMSLCVACRIFDCPFSGFNYWSCFVIGPRSIQTHTRRTYCLTVDCCYSRFVFAFFLDFLVSAVWHKRLRIWGIVQATTVHRVVWGTLAHDVNWSNHLFIFSKGKFYALDKTSSSMAWPIVTVTQSRSRCNGVKLMKSRFVWSVHRTFCIPLRANVVSVCVSLLNVINW